MWSRDLTTEGAEVTGMSSLTADNGAVILPKLFRRLKDYLDLAPAAPALSCFRAFLGGAADRFYLQGSRNRSPACTTSSRSTPQDRP